MKIQILKPIIVVTATLLGTSIVSSSGISKTPEQAKQASNQIDKMKFDGVWAGPHQGNVTLIKQMDGYILFQGKDIVSTWTGKGVITGDTVVCRGTGLTKDNHHFTYESTLTIKDGVLYDSWKCLFANGKELKGRDTLKKVVIANHGKPTPPTP